MFYICTGIFRQLDSATITTELAFSVIPKYLFIVNILIFSVILELLFMKLT